MIYAQPGSAFSASVLGMPTGLTGTLGVRVINAASGATVVARATAGITEVVAGSGSYVAQIAAPGTPGRYVVLWDTGTVSPSTTAAEDLVVSTSVGANGELVLLFGSSVSYVGPVAASGDITLVTGDDYLTADGRQLKFTDTAGLWPTLTGATAVLKVGTGPGSGATLSSSATIVTATGSNKEVDVAVTRAQSATLAVGTFYKYALIATLSDGSVVTLSSGRLTILGQPV